MRFPGENVSKMLAVLSGTALHRGALNIDYPFGQIQLAVLSGTALHRGGSGSEDPVPAPGGFSPSSPGRPFIEAGPQTADTASSKSDLAVLSGTALHRGDSYHDAVHAQRNNLAVLSGTALHRGVHVLGSEPGRTPLLAVLSGTALHRGFFWISGVRESLSLAVLSGTALHRGLAGGSVTHSVTGSPSSPGRPFIEAATRAGRTSPPPTQLAVLSGTALHRGFRPRRERRERRGTPRRPLRDGPSSRRRDVDEVEGHGDSSRRPLRDGPSSRHAAGEARRTVIDVDSPSSPGRPFIEARSRRCWPHHRRSSPSSPGRPFIEASAGKAETGQRGLAVLSGTALHRGSPQSVATLVSAAGTALHRGTSTTASSGTLTINSPSSPGRPFIEARQRRRSSR